MRTRPVNAFNLKLEDEILQGRECLRIVAIEKLHGRIFCQLQTEAGTIRHWTKGPQATIRVIVK